MINRIFIFLLLLCSLSASAQLTPIQDTVPPSGSLPFVPTYRYKIVNGNRIPYLYYPTLNKYDAIPTNAYLRDNGTGRAYSGKTAYYVGDSFSEMNIWQPTVSKKLGITLTGSGIGGSCITGGTGTAEGDGTYRMPFVDRIAAAIAANPSIIFIEGGSNDFHYNVPMGSVNDTVNTTFYGALKYICNQVMTRNIRLVFITPTFRGDASRGGTSGPANYGPWLGYVQAIKEIAYKYSADVIDASQCGINASNTFIYTVDGVHPSNGPGSFIYSNYIADNFGKSSNYSPLYVGTTVEVRTNSPLNVFYNYYMKNANPMGVTTLRGDDDKGGAFDLFASGSKYAYDSVSSVILQSHNNRPLILNQGDGKTRISLRNGKIRDDVTGNYFLESGLGANNVRTNAQQDSIGVIHLKDVPTMMAYTGQATTVIVDAPNSGGIFVANPAIVVTNYYNRIASAKGGAWVRQADMKGGINPLWDYRVKADAIYNYTTLKANPGYTDNTPYLQQMINSVRQGAIHLRFQPTYPNYIGCANTLYVRSGTIIEGDESLFPLQVGTDSLKFPVMSGLYFEKGGLTSAADSNYRMQRPIVKNIAIVGSGKNNGYAAYKALINKNFVGPSGTGTIHQDPGLPNFHNVTIAGFSVGYDLQTSNDTWIEGGLVQYCGIGFKGGRNGLRINTSDFFANDTIGIAKGAINNIHDCLFESGIHGLFVDSGYLSKVHDNTFKTFTYDGLTIKGNTGASQFNNNTFSGDMRHGIVLRNAGNNNAVQGNSFANFATSPLYITNTQKVFIDGNTIVAPANSNHPAIQADTSVTPVIGFTNSIDYAYNRKFSATGSAHAANEILNSLLIKGSYAYNLYPGISTYHAGNDMYNPSLLPTGQTISSWNATEYIGTTTPGRTAYWTFETEEQQNTTAQGSSFNVYLTPLGTAVTKKAYAFLPSGLVFSNGTNQVKLLSLNNGSNTGFRITPNVTNQNLQVDYRPSGTATTTVVTYDNSGDASNSGALAISVTGAQAYMHGQTLGTGTAIAGLHLGAANTAVGGFAAIATTFLDATNINLSNQAANSIIKSDASKNLVPAVVGVDYAGVRGHVIMSASITGLLNYDYLNNTTSTYTITVPATTGFAADGSSIITALQTGTGTIRIACPTGYTLTTPSGQVTPSTGYASIAQNQKVQLIPIGANAWYIQPLNGSITVN